MILNDIPSLIQGAGAIVGAASVLASLLPQPQQDKANKIITAARKLLDALAFNFGHAKNKTKN